MGSLQLCFLLAIAAFSIVNGNDTPAFRTGIFDFLLFHKMIQTMCLHKAAIFNKACLIPFVIAFFKIHNPLAWEFGTFKTVGYRFFFDTILCFTFATMLRLSIITIQTASTRLLAITMFDARTRSFTFAFIST